MCDLETGRVVAVMVLVPEARRHGDGVASCCNVCCEEKEGGRSREGGLLRQLRTDSPSPLLAENPAAASYLTREPHVGHNEQPSSQKKRRHALSYGEIIEQGGCTK